MGGAVVEVVGVGGAVVEVVGVGVVVRGRGRGQVPLAVRRRGRHGLLRVPTICGGLCVWVVSSSGHVGSEHDRHKRMDVA